MTDPDFLIAFEPPDDSWATWVLTSFREVDRRPKVVPPDEPPSHVSRLWVVYSRRASRSRRIRERIGLAQQVVLLLVDDDDVPLPDPPFDLIRLTLPDAPLDRLEARLLGRDHTEEPSGPLGPRTNWVNRERELRALTESGSRVAVTGPPGIGKTALVSRFVASLRPGTDVYWISAGDVSGRRYPSDSLLVIDGAADHRSIADALRINVGARVIVTSRSDQWPFEVLRLEELSQQDSLKLLTRAGLNRLDSLALWRKLGGVPGALNRAASVMAQRPDILAELEMLEDTIRGADEGGFYLLDTSDPRVISAFERAFVELAGGIELGAAVSGSWKRLWRRADRAAEVVALARPEGEANKSNAEAIALLMQASAAITNTVICSGSILFVKITDERGTHVLSKTLSPEELRRLEERQHLLTNPAAAIDFLKLLEAGSV